MATRKTASKNRATKKPTPKKPAVKKAAAKKPAAKKAAAKPAASKPVAKKPAAKKAAAKKPAASKPAAKTPAARKPATSKPAATAPAAKKPAAGKPAAPEAPAKKSSPRRPPAAQPAPEASAEQRSPAAVAYGNAVSEIIDKRPRDSAYEPSVVMDLRVVNRRAPRTSAALYPDERVQLAALFGSEPLDEALEDPEYGVEVAEVVDAEGVLRYRLYGWNYGVGYLMPPSGLDVVAFGAQHDIEHWNRAQRDVFVAMDRALGRKDHGFMQPLSFCWWKDRCWDELDGKEPGTVGSEPHLRRAMAKAAALATRKV